jgi:hypothetical protein
VAFEIDEDRSELIATPKRSGKGNDVAIIPIGANLVGRERKKTNERRKGVQCEKREEVPSVVE